MGKIFVGFLLLISSFLAISSTAHNTILLKNNIEEKNTYLIIDGIITGDATIHKTNCDLNSRESVFLNPCESVFLNIWGVKKFTLLVYCIGIEEEKDRKNAYSTFSLTGEYTDSGEWQTYIYNKGHKMNIKLENHDANVLIFCVDNKLFDNMVGAQLCNNALKATTPLDSLPKLIDYYPSLHIASFEKNAPNKIEKESIIYMKDDDILSICRNAGKEYFESQYKMFLDVIVDNSRTGSWLTQHWNTSEVELMNLQQSYSNLFQDVLKRGSLETKIEFLMVREKYLKCLVTCVLARKLIKNFSQVMEIFQVNPTCSDNLGGIITTLQERGSALLALDKNALIMNSLLVYDEETKLEPDLRPLQYENEAKNEIDYYYLFPLPDTIEK